MPLIRRSPGSDAGRASAIAASIESWATTNAGTASARARSVRHARKAPSSADSPSRRRAARTHPAAGRRAAAASRCRSCRGSGRPRHEPVKEATGPSARLAAPGLALLRPGQGEVDPGPGDPDVEESALLFERRVVIERLADRQEAFLEHRQEDSVPLEALRPVVRRQLDAGGRRRFLRRRSPPEIRLERGSRRLPGPPPRGPRRSRRAFRAPRRVRPPRPVRRAAPSSYPSSFVHRARTAAASARRSPPRPARPGRSRL